MSESAPPPPKRLQSPSGAKGPDLLGPKGVNFSYLFSRWPLYQRHEFADEAALRQFAENLADAPIGIDLYCPSCGKEVPFARSPSRQYMMRRVAVPSSRIEIPTDGKIIGVLLYCARSADHTACVLIQVGSNVATKVGQSPSLRDLADANLRAFRPVMQDEEFLQLRTAVGLHAHGIGIGALVYLRRVVEWLLSEAESQHQRDNPNCNLPYPKEARFADKIRALSHYLPTFLVEHAQIYGVVSAGIHNFTEADARELFPVVLDGICIALQERVEAENRSQARALASRSVLAAADAIKRVAARDAPEHPKADD